MQGANPMQPNIHTGGLEPLRMLQAYRSGHPFSNPVFQPPAQVLPPAPPSAAQSPATPPMTGQSPFTDPQSGGK
jgi:hypothetical protein